MAHLPSPSPLREYRPGIWLKESWLRFCGATLQTRMTVVRLEAGLLLHSPSPAALTAEIRAEFEALGTPRYLLAPNEIHNVGLVPFQQAYPTLHTTGCLGHPKRVKRARFDVLLGPSSKADAVPWTASGELEFHVIRGNRVLHEVALFHKASKTLILTDAVEFIDIETHVAPPLPPRWALRLTEHMGLRYGAPCMSPEHHLLCRDPAALRESFAAIEAWDFEALIIAHGRLLQGSVARDALREAFSSTIRDVEHRGLPARLLWALFAKSQGGD